jgi:hypothetical protein
MLQAFIFAQVNRWNASRDMRERTLPCQTREAISADQPIIITLNENWIQNLDRKRLKFISITW